MSVFSEVLTDWYKQFVTGRRRGQSKVSRGPPIAPNLSLCSLKNLYQTALLCNNIITRLKEDIFFQASVPTASSVIHSISSHKYYNNDRIQDEYLSGWCIARDNVASRR
jgi:hypothetical protein